MFRNALPDLYFSIEDMIAEGDKVVTLYTSYGTHLGETHGYASYQKEIDCFRNCH